MTTVLPFVWIDHSSPHRSIHHALHDGREVYQAMKGAASPTHPWVLQATNASPWVTTYHESLEAVRAAAQASWDQFIRSAISEVTPSTAHYTGLNALQRPAMDNAGRDLT